MQLDTELSPAGRQRKETELAWTRVGTEDVLHVGSNNPGLGLEREESHLLSLLPEQGGKDHPPWEAEEPPLHPCYQSAASPAHVSESSDPKEAELKLLKSPTNEEKIPTNTPTIPISTGS